jgi:putative addiction module component (TIGR02574 family)
MEKPSRKVSVMSKAELLEEFAKLTPAERSELWDALWSLEERDLLGVSAPTPEEKDVLDREMDEYRKNPHVGSPWNTVEARLRNQL